LSCIPHIDLRSSLRDNFYSYLCLSSLHLEPTPSTFLLGNNLCNSLSPPSCFKKPTKTNKKQNPTTYPQNLHHHTNRMASLLPVHNSDSHPAPWQCLGHLLHLIPLPKGTLPMLFPLPLVPCPPHKWTSWPLLILTQPRSWSTPQPLPPHAALVLLPQPSQCLIILALHPLLLPTSLLA
jgi:hypothetical protein